jgi:hypothetical protein
VLDEKHGCPTMMSIATIMKRTVSPARRKSSIEISIYPQILLYRTTNKRTIKNAVSNESLKFLFLLASSSLWVNLMQRNRTPNTSKAMKSGISENHNHSAVLILQLEIIT